MSFKIAIDTSPLRTGHAVRGIGSYTKNLGQVLERVIKKPEYQGFKVEFIVEPTEINKQKFDLVHYPYFDLFNSTLPLRKLTKTVVTIHDVIPLVYPEHYPPGLKGKIKFWRQRFSLQSADAVLTDSLCSKNDIVKYLRYPENKISVVYLAAADGYRVLEPGKWSGIIRAKYHLPEKFVLYVGDVNWNKNILGLARVCERNRWPLVIVGQQATRTDFDHKHIENQPLVALLTEFGESQIIQRLGFVPEEDLVKIYNLATIYCQPSYYEGFGLTVLEAMACGCPVVCTTGGSLSEITGRAALLVTPGDDMMLTEKLKTLWVDKKLRETLISAGLENARQYSWTKTAGEVLNIYEKVVEQK